MPSEPVPTESASATSLPAPVFAGRLHPLTLVFGALGSVRGLIAFIPLLAFSRNRAWYVLALLGVAIPLITALTRYFSFRYRIENNELLTEQGIIEKQKRSIPLDRIQEISVTQNLFHRFFDVVEAKIETGGGQGAEATLSVLSRAQVDELRRAVFARARGGAAQAGAASAGEPEAAVIHQLSLWDLTLAGLTTNHIVSALVIAGAIWNFADDVLPDSFYKRAANAARAAGNQLLAQDAWTALAIALGGVLFVFLTGMFFSVLGSVVRFYGFTFARRGDDLRRNFGLLTRHASTLPRRRIQTLKIEETLLRRLFGLAALRVDTAGSRRESEDDKQGRNVLVPLLRAHELPALLPAIFPGYVEDEATWRRVAPVAVKRETIEGAWLCLILAAVLYVWRGSPWALWPLALIPALYFLNHASYRHLGFALGESYLQMRRGWLGRATYIVPLNRIQAVLLHQGPVDRWLGLASLRVDTAGQAHTGGGPVVENLPFAEAEALARTLAHKAAARRWR
ncbi:MAG: PH domain-containing protein [Blastocatellia bacterium]